MATAIDAIANASTEEIPAICLVPIRLVTPDLALLAMQQENGRKVTAMVTDVSSVGLDWLYLHTDRPIFLTDPHGDVGSQAEQKRPGPRSSIGSNRCVGPYPLRA